HHDCLRYTLVDGSAEWRFRGAGGRTPEGSGRNDTGGRPAQLGRGSFATNDGTVLREAMLAGLGLAVLPYLMVARGVAAGRAELVLEGQRRAEIGVYAVVASARGLPLRVRALIEHPRRHFAKPDWREGGGSGGGAGKRRARLRLSP